MSRTRQQIVADLAAAARLTEFSATTSWYDVLFEPAATEPTLAAPEQPDRALLLALADEYAVLERHLDSLPERTHLAWLEDVLRIPRLPVVPDRVVAHAQVDPKLAPAVVPRGTLLRGGKDAFGNERRYATVDALTAHGAALIGVRSLTPTSVGGPVGLPGQIASAPDFPLTPSQLHPQAAQSAPHRMRIYSPALVFEGGDMTVELAFMGATGVDGLAHASWYCSQKDTDPNPPVFTGTVAGSSVSVTLSGSCRAPEGELPWIECSITPTHDVPVSLAFTDVTVRVTARSPFVPQAAFYNDGALDLSKEFQPFGAVAKRGDAFWLRSDEAFSKDTEAIGIIVEVMQEGGAPLSASSGGSGIPPQLITLMGSKLTGVKQVIGVNAAASSLIDEILGLFDDTSDPSIKWQCRDGREWFTIGTPQSSFGSISASMPGGSDAMVISGQAGHYIRAFLSAGDFGWTKYQSDLADFATKAADGNPATVGQMPKPPVPPIASSLTLTYTTRAVLADRVEALSGWRRTRKGTGSYHPFRRTVSEAGDTGMVALGLELPRSALGSTVSLYLDVDSAAPCGSSAAVTASWEWWDGTAWRPLPVADGSHQLRESGLLRFVAPLLWQAGCSDVNATSGRWVRLVTRAPERLGVIRNVVVDAVIAEFVSRALDPARDPS